MATRKTEKEAEQLRISQIGDFKQRMGGIIELPSGLIVRWRNPGGLRAFMANGQIPNTLMPIVERSLKGGKGVEEEVNAELMQKLQDDPEMIGQLMGLYDSIARKCIVEPKLYPVPDEEMLQNWNLAHPDDPLDDPEDLRYEDRLYVDELPDDDKAYIFQLISGGVKDLETFRQQNQISMDGLARVSGVVGHTVGDSGADAG